jgi:hypothetical protein
MGMKTPIEISDLLGGNILGILVVLTFLVDLNWLLD